MKFILLVSAAFSLLAMGYGGNSNLSMDPDQAPIVFANLEDWLKDLLKRIGQLRTMVISAESLPGMTPEESLIVSKAKNSLDPIILVGKAEAHVVSVAQQLATVLPTRVGTCSYTNKKFSCISV